MIVELKLTVAATVLLLATPVLPSAVPVTPATELLLLLASVLAAIGRRTKQEAATDVVACPWCKALTAHENLGRRTELDCTQSRLITLVGRRCTRCRGEHFRREPGCRC